MGLWPSWCESWIRFWTALEWSGWRCSHWFESGRSSNERSSSSERRCCCPQHPVRGRFSLPANLDWRRQRFQKFRNRRHDSARWLCTRRSKASLWWQIWSGRGSRKFLEWKSHFRRRRFSARNRRVWIRAASAFETWPCCQVCRNWHPTWAGQGRAKRPLKAEWEAAAEQKIRRELSEWKVESENFRLFLPEILPAEEWKWRGLEWLHWWRPPLEWRGQATSCASSSTGRAPSSRPTGRRRWAWSRPGAWAGSRGRPTWQLSRSCAAFASSNCWNLDQVKQRKVGQNCLPELNHFRLILPDLAHWHCLVASVDHQSCCYHSQN